MGAGRQAARRQHGTRRVPPHGALAAAALWATRQRRAMAESTVCAHLHQGKHIAVWRASVPGVCV